jgi:hypothetical protein
MMAAQFSRESKPRLSWTSTLAEVGVLSPRCNPPQVPPCPRGNDDPCACVRNLSVVTRRGVFPEDKRNDWWSRLIFSLCLLAIVRSSAVTAAAKDKAVVGSTAAASARSSKVPLPDQYFRLLEAGATRFEQHLAAHPKADLQTLEARDESWRLLSHAALVAAVLHAKHDPANRSYQHPQMLSLATRVGDLLADQSEREQFEARLNSDRDIYVWLETYRLLKDKLGAEREGRWRRELEKNVAELASDVAARKDFPGYQSPYIGTSPNHYALWASTVYLAGRVFGQREWETLGASVMHRFAEEEQSPDGYWGEHERSLPTPGYGYNTYASVALYAEWSRDPAAMKALRRGLDFHKFFTYPDGTPVEVLDDRNRYTLVAGWGESGASTWPDSNSPPGGNDESASKGHFGFSWFPDGRSYAQLLTRFFREGLVGCEDLGRLAQNALYYHRGPAAPIPQEQPHYSRQLSVAAGIRKSGSWVVSLSGLISTQAISNQFYLDRQGHISVFHDKVGLIVTGANSKRQPELATLTEELPGQLIHVPLSSRLQMSAVRDRLSLAFNTFFCDLLIPAPSENRLSFRFVITGRGDPAPQQYLNLQLCLKAGDILETAAGKNFVLDAQRVELSPADIGGWIRHRSWKLSVDPAAQIVWPVYPHNPYANGPEKSPKHAVGGLKVPLRLKPQIEDWTVLPGEREIAFELEVD